MEVSGHRSVEILSLLGQGGFGKVYRGREVSEGGFHRDVAIKVLHPDRVTDDLLARLRDEARTLLLLRDRAIVSAQPPIQLGDQWAVVMEFIDGLSVREVLDNLGPMPPSVAVEIVGEVARALDAAYHQEGPNGPLKLIHRDIKSPNLQITRTGEVKILDFGAAHASFDLREAQTQSRMVVGTPHYMAPEQYRGIIGPEGDIYALGVTFYEMILGHRPPQDPDHSLAPEPPGARGALALAEKMRDPRADLRPSGREVAAQCRALASSLPGVGLTEWAHGLPPRTSLRDDQVGRVYTVSVQATRSLLQGVSPSGGAWISLAALSTLVAVSLAGVTAAAVMVTTFRSIDLGDPQVSSGVEAPSPPVEVPPADPGAPQVVAAPIREEAEAPPTVIAATAQPRPKNTAPPAAMAPSSASREAPAPTAPEPVAPEPAEPAPEGVASVPAVGAADDGISGFPEEDPTEVAGTAIEAPSAPAVMVPPPAAPAAPTLSSGRWTGTLKGLPMTLDLKVSGTSITGQLRVDLGVQIQTEDVVGQIRSDGTVSLSAGIYQMQGGLVRGNALSGTYRRGGSRKDLPWSVALGG